MKFNIQPINKHDAIEMTRWRYEPPYSVYNMTEDSVPELLRPVYRYHSVFDDQGDLVGLCCFGLDAHVKGGDYSAGEPEVLDVGIGLRPDATGKGLGKSFLGAVLDFAEQIYAPLVFRATIAEFNQRSEKMFKNLGFRETHQFARQSDGMKFLQFEKNLPE